MRLPFIDSDLLHIEVQIKSGFTLFYFEMRSKWDPNS